MPLPPRGQGCPRPNQSVVNSASCGSSSVPASAAAGSIMQPQRPPGGRRAAAQRHPRPLSPAVDLPQRLQGAQRRNPDHLPSLLHRPARPIPCARNRWRNRFRDGGRKVSSEPIGGLVQVPTAELLQAFRSASSEIHIGYALVSQRRVEST